MQATYPSRKSSFVDSDQTHLAFSITLCFAWCFAASATRVGLSAVIERPVARRRRWECASGHVIANPSTHFYACLTSLQPCSCESRNRIKVTTATVYSRSTAAWPPSRDVLEVLGYEWRRVEPAGASYWWSGRSGGPRDRDSAGAGVAHWWHYQLKMDRSGWWALSVVMLVISLTVSIYSKNSEYTGVCTCVQQADNRCFFSPRLCTWTRLLWVWVTYIPNATW